jgi:uncharacterized protein (TIGR01777 family)
MIRALITGGTGFVGRKLTHTLLARGWQVTVLSRDVSLARGKLDARVRVAGWSPGSRQLVEEVSGVDVVVSLAGAGVFDQPWTHARLEVLRESRVGSTRDLSLALAQAKKKPKLLVSASAVGIYGMRKDSAVLGEDGSLGTDVLAEICKAWEKAADPAREAGIRVLHPRLGIVLGADGGALAKMLPAFKWFVGGPLGDGQQYVSWIHWRDVVDAICFAYEKVELAGPANFTSPDPVKMEELAKSIGLVLNRGARMRVPPFAVRLMVGEGAADALLTGQRAVPRKLSAAGFAFSYPELVPALEELIGPK